MSKITFNIQDFVEANITPLMNNSNYQAVEKYIRKGSTAVEFLKIICNDLKSKDIDLQGHSHVLFDVQNLMKSGSSFTEIFSKDVDDKLTIFKNQFIIFFKAEVSVYLLSLMIEKETSSSKVCSIINNVLNNLLFSTSRCECCGENLNQIKSLGGKNSKQCIMNIADVQEVMIDVPSGTLLCSDWFRDEKNVVDTQTSIKKSKSATFLKKSKNFAVNSEFSALGEYAQILACSEQNMLSVYVGNSSPSVSQQGNSLIVSQGEQAEEFIKGYISTDLWRASILDKETLLNMLKKRYKPEELTDVMAEIFDNSHIFEITVKPGKYKVTYSPKYKPISQTEEHKIFCKMELCE